MNLRHKGQATWYKAGMDQATVSSQFVTALGDYLQLHKLRAPTVERAINSLRQHKRVPLADYAGLLEEAARSSGDEHIGLHIGATPLPDNWGLLSYLAITAPNALLAIRVLMEYSALQFDFGHFVLNTARIGEGLVSLEWRSDISGPLNRHVMEHLYANVLTLSDQQVGLQRPQLSLHFMHAAPRDPGYAERLLRATVHYEQPVYKAVFSAAFLTDQTQQPDSTRYTLAVTLARQRLKALDSDDELIHRLNQRILEALPFGLPKLDSIARAMSTSSRSLQRHLRQRELSYQGLLDSVRRELAIDLINRRELSLNDIADYLAFNDQSAFQHAFKRWLGCTPGQYKRNYAAKEIKKGDGDR